MCCGLFLMELQAFCSTEHKPTEATAGGALYINKKHSYKICPDLTIHKAKKITDPN